MIPLRPGANQDKPNATKYMSMHQCAKQNKNMNSETIKLTNENIKEKG